MPKDHDPDAPKLSEVQVQVLSILGSEGNVTDMLILDKRAGGQRYALRSIKREEEDDDVRIDCARAEAEASPKLGHPAILRTYDFRPVKSFFKVVKAEQLMEYVDGKTLDKVETLPVPLGVLIFQKAASALAHMQRRGVLHGDLRPANIVLSRSGHVKIRGYGRSLVNAKFRPKLAFHAHYAAPEQPKEKAIDPKTEVYSLGATFYHILTGQPPVAGASGRDGGRKLAMPSAVNVKIPTAVNNLLVACLQSDPNRRPAEPYNVLQTLDGLLQEMKVDESLLAGITADDA